MPRLLAIEWDPAEVRVLVGTTSGASVSVEQAFTLPLLARADAAALTPPSIKSMADKGGGDVEMAQPFHTAPWAIAYSAPPFRKEDITLREAFNRAAKAFVGTDEYLSLLTKVGRGQDSLPGDMTAAEQCAKKS